MIYIPDYRFTGAYRCKSCNCHYFNAWAKTWDEYPTGEYFFITKRLKCNNKLYHARWVGFDEDVITFELSYKNSDICCLKLSSHKDITPQNIKEKIELLLTFC